MAESKEVALIAPIKEIVAGYSVKVQVHIDEDATDKQILSSLDDACRQWSNVQRVDMGLRLVVGKLLMAVRQREIYKNEDWGTFEKFLAHVEERYGLKRSTAWASLEIIEARPDITDEQAELIGSTNLLYAARAVKQAPDNQRKKISRQVFKRAEERPSIEVFRRELENANLIRSGQRTRRGMGRLVLASVPTEVMALWRELVGKQNAVKVFSDLVRIAHGAEKSRGRGSKRGAGA